MQYYNSRFLVDRRRLKFEAYVTDILKGLAEMNGARIDKRYIETLYVVEDTRSGDEIAADIILRAGLRFKES